ncbi:MAG: ATP-binding protein [Coriobacteriia bacterium]|nr:ATP-binding protein [Coriobacteriia bacterium]
MMLADTQLLVALIAVLLCGIGIGWLFFTFINKDKLQKAAQDTLEEKISREADQLARQQADEIQEARRAFTANVSHELKTPLTVISGYSELLKDGNVRQEDITDVSTVVFEEACYMLNLVDDILSLSQLDEYIATDNTSAHLAPVDLVQLAEGVLAQLEPFAKQNHVKCQLNSTGDTTIMGIKRLLVSVIYNLCENSIRYNVPGGSMSVNIEGLSDKVRLEVVDTGLGIPKEAQPRVFERFYRIDSAHSRHLGGTGLGLAIVKHGAQYHKATLSLESKPLEGTQVTVEFPR